MGPGRGSRISAQAHHTGNQRVPLLKSRLDLDGRCSVQVLSGGAYGEIDFCVNGYFTDSSESSIRVQIQDYTGDTIASAGAGSVGTYSGRWSVEQRDGEPSLVLQYDNGNRYYYSSYRS